MKRLLLDSHELVWVLFEPERISKRTAQLIQEAYVVKISLASIWELAIKHSKNKLAYNPKELLDGVGVLGVELLELDPAHILQLQHTKTVHKDPFDRMLLAQAKVERLELLTADAEILKLNLDYVIDARK